MSESKGSSSAGIGAGSILGMVLCWVKWHSAVSLIWPAIFGWGYVIYFLMSYGTNF